MACSVWPTYIRSALRFAYAQASSGEAGCPASIRTPSWAVSAASSPRHSRHSALDSIHRFRPALSSSPRSWCSRSADRSVASASSQRSSRAHSPPRPSCRAASVASSAPAANRSARSNWAAASRCAPRAADRRAASGAWRRTAGASAAPSAWWASSAGSAPPRSSSAVSSRLCSSAVRCGGMLASTAIRTSSCRNRSPGPSAMRIPVLRPSSRPAVSPGPSAGSAAWLVQRRGQQLAVHPAADDRGRLDQAAGAGGGPGEAGADRVADGGRDGRPAGFEDLADVERVAAGDPVQLGRVGAVRPGQRGDGADRQRRHPHPAGGPLGGQVAEHHPERVVRGDLLVPVGGQDQGRYPGQAAAEVAEQVGGGLVGPVQVLDDHDGQRARCSQLGQERGEQLIPGGALAAQHGELPAGLRADVEQRAQRPRGQQPVAASPQPARVRQLLLERLGQHGLAHPGLTGDQHQPPAALPRVLRVPGQRVQERCSFQQLHGSANPQSLPRILTWPCR